MSSRYRGHTIPTPEKEDGIWYVADPKVGWFQSPTKKNVLIMWHLKVDSIELKQAREDGLLLHREAGDVCAKCGIAPAEVLLHLDWHEKLDKA